MATCKTPLAAILIFLLLAAVSTSTANGPPKITLVNQPGAVRVLADATYGDTLSALISKASQRIDLAMFLFKTSRTSDNLPAELIRDLIAAKQRGVEVRIILEYSSHDQKLNRANQETAETLRKGGVKVVFDSPGRTNHAKLAVIDRRYCLVGSHNLTQSALKYNHEFSLLLDSPPLAGEILAYMETILK
ncbi:MAG: phospholipase [Desulfurivibrio sp.]|nr:phospholipase [Desulfurivibrio sp.]MBU3937193.1 phospholipase [Pseudomonadota bacterium]MBU4034624.1 phospholipase [Pseudomonadota bacterium]MBU4119041.1 phospholipase [Pseudomonadota bacterium]